MENTIAAHLISRRFIYFICATLFLLLLSTGLEKLRFETDYKIFFGKDNPQLLAHEYIQDEYTRSDSLVFLIATTDQTDLFTAQRLSALQSLTEAAWQLPYSIRVDSIANYQHTHVEGDELFVADLVETPASLSASQLSELHQIALNNIELENFALSTDGRASAISVKVLLPDDTTEASQANSEIVKAARLLAADFSQKHSDLEIHLLGSTVVNNTFVEMTESDGAQLFPIMFLVVLLIMTVLFRSWVATVATLLCIIATTVSTLGIVGWLNIPLNQVSVSAPTIVLTLCICDAVHLLNSFFLYYRQGDNKKDAMQKSLAVNLYPIMLTSITTAIGFLSMMLSDSPPFQELGLISAIGVILAMFFTLLMIPALIILLPVKQIPSSNPLQRFSLSISGLVIKHYRSIFWIGILLSISLCLLIPKNELNDDTIAYFKDDVPFKQAAEFAKKSIPGFDIIEYSLDSGHANGVNDPAFLKSVEQFVDWYRQLDEVVNVSSYTDTLKRLNQDMHDDDPDYYRIPDSPELAAQYLLLYELSLPFGLDLNHQINFEKSALKVTVKLYDQSSQKLIDIENQAQAWLQENAPELVTTGSSASIMFAHLGLRNISSMIWGSIVALVFVSVALIFALRSTKYGLISLIPNIFPAAMAFGIWALFNGTVNVAVSVVFAITLGIIVDDTIHFVSKYLAARNKQNLSPEKAINYTFSIVGPAIIITTLILSAGFLVLAQSSFNVNAHTGLMASMTIGIALVFDLLILPALLLLLSKRKASVGSET